MEDESSDTSNALVDKSYTDDLSSSANQPQVPASTQTAIAEALHLDPVLNNNILSVADLAAFFGGNMPAAGGNQHSSYTNQNDFALKHMRKEKEPAAFSDLAQKF